MGTLDSPEADLINRECGGRKRELTGWDEGRGVEVVGARWDVTRRRI